jgi:hypothetical protein
MTFLLRVGLVIGMIFYLSPVRKAGDPMAAPPASRSAGAIHAPLPEALLAEILTGASPRPAAATPPDLAAEAERLWRRLPSDVQRAVLQRIQAGIASPAERPASEPARADERHPPTRHGEPPRRP